MYACVGVRVSECRFMCKYIFSRMCMYSHTYRCVNVCMSVWESVGVLVCYILVYTYVYVRI